MDTWKHTLKNYWGDRLHRFDKKEISSVNVDEETKDILLELGLPYIEIESALIFKPSSSLKRIEFKAEKYIILGNNVGDDDLGIFVCIKENSSEIFQLHTKYNEAVIFMNSNIKSFLLFLKRYSEFILIGQDLSEDEFIQRKDMVINLKRDFISIDPKALSGSSYYWILIFAELQGFIE